MKKLLPIVALSLALIPATSVRAAGPTDPVPPPGNYAVTASTSGPTDPVPPPGTFAVIFTTLLSFFL